MFAANVGARNGSRPMENIGFAWLLLCFFVGAIPAAVAEFKYLSLARRCYNKRSQRADVGPYTFDLRYLRALRNPSGRIILDWTDELDGPHNVLDPRVLVRETRGSKVARIFTLGAAPAEDDYAAAVQKHLGNGWLIVTATDATYMPLIRWISHCVVHFRPRDNE